MINFKFELFDHVTKITGYPYPGIIVARFTNMQNEIRYVVEASGDNYKGMLHIFNESQLK